MSNCNNIDPEYDCKDGTQQTQSLSVVLVKSGILKGTLHFKINLGSKVSLDPP